MSTAVLGAAIDSLDVVALALMLNNTNGVLMRNRSALEDDGFWRLMRSYYQPS